MSTTKLVYWNPKVLIGILPPRPGAERTYAWVPTAYAVGFHLPPFGLTVQIVKTLKLQVAGVFDCHLPFPT
jgi:hypothetical protein